MVKIGPGFFDSVSLQKIKGHRSFSNFTTHEFASIVPQILLAIFFLIILARLFYVQILRGDYYRRLSDENRTKTKVIPAPRGIILDRLGRPLVTNSARFNIVQNGKKKSIPRKEALARIARGEKVENDVAREYLYKSDFAHVLGYVGQISEAEATLPRFSEHDLNDWVGKIGLEEAYENILHGKNGKELFEVDSNGAIVRSLGTEESVAGINITTTLDLNIGLSVASAMKGIEKGAVVVSDPRNGAILALYSRPSFDPNIFTLRLDGGGVSEASDFIPDGEYETIEGILADQEKHPLLNRAIGGLYAPGSTFKLITAVAALEDGAIKSDTQIVDTGILRVGEFSFGNWYFLQYGRTDGPLNVVGAIKRSNDIFFYKAAEGAGVDKISSYAWEFGLGEKVGIDLEGEEKGIVPTRAWKEETIGEQWYLGDTYNYGIGQGYLLTTPLQVNMFTTAFANGGTLYKPYLSGEKKTLRKNFIKRENVEQVQQGMRQSCERGGVAFPFFDFKVESSRLASDDKNYIRDASVSADMVRITVGCKTGTAETGGEDTEPHAWITVFAPFYNPEIVVTVLVENGGEGSSVAGPIAKEILTDYFEQK